jgi:S-formylglutathione hydrolase
MRHVHAAHSTRVQAFTGYLGADRGAWQTYDATELIKTYTGPNPNILIDQGTKDQFLVDQLKPTHFVDACTSAGKTCTLRMQQDYDHSYYFISTFIGNHIEHHAKHLHA